ncbi:mitochondrial 54S ribosomal protein uL1m [Kockiozyma suomiensis]|uniref:mitochondrial 54S ribosomal protein uL1m n=1 Tax=Kockiozyma suomiensis TaxID=1337062 RepID=UPI0033439A83
MITRRETMLKFARASVFSLRPTLHVQTSVCPATIRFKSNKNTAKGGDKSGAAGFAQREAAAKKAEKEKRQRETKRKVERLRLEARNTAVYPITMDIPTATRYLQAAEVGRPDGQNIISLILKLALPLHSQSIRGSVRLPKSPVIERVAVFTDDEEVAALALKNGATYAGGEELIDKVRKDQITFEKAFATPAALPLLRGVQRILGPKGLMPSERRGTVGNDVVDYLRNTSGFLNFRTHNDTLHAIIGRTSFPLEDIRANIDSIMAAYRVAVREANQRQKPLIREVILTSTHGPSVNIIA